MKNTTKYLETLLAQVARINTYRQPGHLLGQPILKKTANAVNLRSGTQYDAPPMPTEDSSPPVHNDVVDENESEDSLKIKIEHMKVDEVENHKDMVTDSLTPPLPFPHRM